MNESVDATVPAPPQRAACRLVLTWGAHEVEVTEKRPSLTVGRGDLSGIVIPVRREFLIPIRKH